MVLNPEPPEDVDWLTDRPALFDGLLTMLLPFFAAVIVLVYLWMV